MASENSLSQDSAAGESDKTFFDKSKVIRLCWEIYLAKGSLVRRSSLSYKYDFEDWLKLTNPATKKSNIDRLITYLSPDFSSEELKTTITRWLNQNLPF